MTSTIHYKFRSATDFETIQLPGSSAKVFDIKRAIVKAKDLDRGNTLEFDLNIKNAMTQESYEDDSMLLPRGTRLIVHRLPAAKGQGLLARFARADAGMMQQVRSTWGNQSAAENGYYTVQNNDDDEFVDAAAAAVAAPAYNSASQEINRQIEDVVDDDDEEAKLIAVIPGQNNGSSPYNSMAKPHGGGQPKFPPGVTAPRPTDGGGGGGNGFSKFKHNPLQQPSNNAYPSRPNADPTLRELEQQQQEGVRKKKKGTPRTFHKVDEHHNGKAFETGFTHLLDRGGGQSEATGGKKRDLDYALQLTATPIPEHLQCGICARVVKDALFIPWDEDGRTACDLCMRRGLSENRMTCPLTNQPVGDGVSPDELRPNKGLRKAVEIFVKGVMEKMDEIVQQQEADEEEEREKNEMAEQEEKVNEFEGDASDKGLIMRKGMKKVGKKSNDDFDDFGGDDFGGDVFTVTRVEDDTTENDKESEEEQSDQKTMKKNATATATDDDQNTKNIEDNNISKHIADDMETTNGAKSAKVMTNTHSTNDVDSSSIMQFKGNYQENAPSNKHNNKHDISQQDHDKSSQGAPVSPTPSARSINRREMLKHRAPPAGYVMGPAGSKGNQMQSSSYNSQQGRGYQNRPYNNRGRDSYNNNRGRGMQPYGQRGRGYNQFNNNFQQPPFDEHKQSEIGNKRPRSDFEASGNHEGVDLESHDESRSQSSHSDRRENFPQRGGRGRGFGGRGGGRDNYGRGRDNGGRGRDNGGRSFNNYGGRGFEGWNSGPNGGRGGFAPNEFHGGPQGGMNFGGRGFDGYGGPPPGFPGGRGDMGRFGPQGGRGDFGRGGRRGQQQGGRGRFGGRFGGRGRY